MNGCVFGWSVITVPRLPVGELFHTGIVVNWNKDDPGKTLVCHFGPFAPTTASTDSSASVRIEPIGVAWRRTMIADGKIYFNTKLRISDRRLSTLQTLYSQAKKDRQGSAAVDLTQGRCWNLWKNNCQDFTRNLFPTRIQHKLLTQLDKDYLLYLAGCLRPLGTDAPSLSQIAPNARYVLTAWDKRFRADGLRK